jgi:uncharacterized membrane protein YdjX (TVP38/TMEM64 family)
VSAHRRVLVTLLLVAIGVLVVVAQPVHAWLLILFDAAEGLIRKQPALGMIAFVLLAAVSALLAFVSSAVLVPVAVYVWGPTACFVLLWIGWYLGGLAGYAIGRFLGRPIVEILVGPGSLARYEGLTRSTRSLVPILLLQLAIPSDLASYLFGMIGCRLAPFALALAVAEVPYALGAVYLGTSFLEGRIVPFLAVGVAGVLLSAWAVRRMHHPAISASPGSLSSSPRVPE